MRALITTIMGACLLGGCASMELSIGTGLGVGAVTGAIAGHSANFNIKGMALATGTGAALGGLAGFLLHRHSEGRGDTGQTTKANIGLEPHLADAEKEVLQIPGKVESDRYTEPHRVFLIKRPSHWVPPEKKNEVKNGQ